MQKTELKFNTAVCTTRKQSQRLLDLGLKPETADMVLFKTYDLPQYPFDYTFNQAPSALTDVRYVPTVKGEQPFIQDGNIPAWSLHRLLFLYGQDYTIKELYNNAEECYGMLISAIEIAIENDEFNKEYLKQ